jgi:hypothetical protein
MTPYEQLRPIATDRMSSLTKTEKSHIENLPLLKTAKKITGFFSFLQPLFTYLAKRQQNQDFIKRLGDGKTHVTTENLFAVCRELVPLREQSHEIRIVLDDFKRRINAKAFQLKDSRLKGAAAVLEAQWSEAASPQPPSIQ